MLVPRLSQNTISLLNDQPFRNNAFVVWWTFTGENRVNTRQKEKGVQRHPSSRFDRVCSNGWAKVEVAWSASARPRFESRH